MANIKLTLPEEEQLFDGKQITFKAPCNCTAPEKITINEKSFSLVDAMGNAMLGRSGNFTQGSLISILLDVTNLKAYLLNPAPYRGGITLSKDVKIESNNSSYGVHIKYTPSEYYSMESFFGGSEVSLFNDNINIVPGKINLRNGGMEINGKNVSTYEEGTFSLWYNGADLMMQNVKYFKIGKLVIVHGYTVCSSAFGYSGEIVIPAYSEFRGLPFAVDNSNAGYASNIMSISPGATQQVPISKTNNNVMQLSGTSILTSAEMKWNASVPIAIFGIYMAAE